MVCVATKVKDIILSSIRSVKDSIIYAIDMMATGAAMIADDIADFPRLDRPHHWIWGLIFIIVGIVIITIAMLMLVVL
jgi:hypothetical protein